MKKIMALALIFVMSISLCACGGGSGETENGVKETVTDTVDANETTEPEAEATEENTAESIQIGEKISLDYVEMTLETFEISDGYSFEYTDSSSGIKITHKSSIECPSGMKLICLKGKFTNKAKSEIYPANNPANGKIIINGYEYETRMKCYNVAEAESVMGVVPLREVDYFLYAEVPDTLVNEIESCEFYIGFVKDMDPSVWISDISECDALYVVDAVPVIE